MPWRVLEYADAVWNVTIAAERRFDTEHWTLVLSFRPEGGARRALWASYPLEATSRSMLFAQAEKIPDDRLRALLADRLG
jgi:hypothetical protein